MATGRKSMHQTSIIVFKDKIYRRLELAKRMSAR